MAITEETLALVASAKQALERLADGPTRSLTSAWVRAWDALTGVFVEAIDELLTVGGDQWPTRGQVERAARTGIALQLTGRALDILARQARDEISAAARQATNQAHHDQNRLVKSQLPEGTTVRFRHASHEQLAQMVNRTMQQIHAATWPLSQQMVDALKRELVRGIAVGDNPRTVARTLMRRLEGEFNGGLSRAMNLARTEILDAYRGASQLSQMANSDVVSGWMWLSALTNRTCFLCWSMHGTVHPLDEPGPLDHPSGRCTRAPVVRPWAELGFDIPEPASLIPDARAVFAALPRAEQLQILGPARLRLLDSGAIGWGDLARMRDNPGWRRSIAPVPLKDL